MLEITECVDQTIYFVFISVFFFMVVTFYYVLTTNSKLFLESSTFHQTGLTVLLVHIQKGKLVAPDFRVGQLDGSQRML